MLVVKIELGFSGKESRPHANLTTEPSLQLHSAIF